MTELLAGLPGRAERALRPYLVQIYLLLYTPPLLVADAHVTALWQQWALGALTFGVLALLSLRVPRGVARQVWICVGVATCFEIFGSLIWGLYRYRFHNLPLYVPPGHGMVYMFAITGSQTPLLLRHGRAVCLLVLAAASAWALAGLTVLVPVTHRLDVDGAAVLPLLAWFLLRSPRATMFAAIFVAVTELELVGTSVGTWTWLPVAPVTHAGSGNPPSAVAGGYAVIDGTVLLVALGIDRLRARLASSLTLLSTKTPGLDLREARLSTEAVGPAAPPRLALEVPAQAED